MAGEPGPFAAGRLALAGEPLDPVVQTPAQGRVVQIGAIHHDDREIRRHPPVPGEIEQGRHQLAPSQVAGSAENDENARVQMGIGVHDPRTGAFFTP